MTEKTEDLIAELREVAKGSIQGTQVIGAPIMRGGELAARAGEALEAVTEDRDYWHGVATTAKDQRDAAVAAIERVRALHAPLSSLTWGAPDEFLVCEECNDPDAWGIDYWPCDTIAALDGGDSGE